MEPLNVRAIKELILWAREERIQIDKIELGELRVEFSDLSLIEPTVTKAQASGGVEWAPGTPLEPKNLYEQLEQRLGLGDAAEQG